MFSYIKISSSYLLAQMKQSHRFLINNEHAVEQFAQSMIKNSVEVFRAMRKL